MTTSQDILSLAEALGFDRHATWLMSAADTLASAVTPSERILGVSEVRVVESEAFGLVTSGALHVWRPDGQRRLLWTQISHAEPVRPGDESAHAPAEVLADGAHLRFTDITPDQLDRWSVLLLSTSGPTETEAPLAATPVATPVEDDAIDDGVIIDLTDEHPVVTQGRPVIDLTDSAVASSDEFDDPDRGGSSQSTPAAPRGGGDPAHLVGNRASATSDTSQTEAPLASSPGRRTSLIDPPPAYTAPTPANDLTNRDQSGTFGGPPVIEPDLRHAPSYESETAAPAPGAPQRSSRDDRTPSVDSPTGPVPDATPSATPDTAPAMVETQTTTSGLSITPPADVVAEPITQVVTTPTVRTDHSASLAPTPDTAAQPLSAEAAELDPSPLARSAPALTPDASPESGISAKAGDGSPGRRTVTSESAASTTTRDRAKDATDASAERARRRAEAEAAAPEPVAQRPFILRLLWWLLVGWWASAIVVVLAWLVSLIVVTLPVATRLMSLGPGLATLHRPLSHPLTFQPAGVASFRRDGQYPAIVRILYLLVAGWLFAALATVLVWVLGVTGIGRKAAGAIVDVYPTILSLQRD